MANGGQGVTFWAQHGVHLALVVVPSSAMGAGLLREHRRGLRQRQAIVVETTSVTGQSAFVPKTWLAPRPGNDTALAARRRSASIGPALAQHPLALPTVAVSAAGAALTHVVVMPQHFSVSLLYGTFFLCAAILQLSWAIAVVYRPTRGTLMAGALGCAATIALWLFSRTFGIPPALGGIGGGAPETVGALDVLATAFELVAVLGVVAALRGATLGGGSPARWPLAAKAIGVTALCGTAALAFWAPVG